MGPIKVAVVGAGLAGLACALAVARAGATVRVFESRPDLSGLAAHVDVVPNLLRDLVQLGLGDACVRLGFPYRRTTTLDQRGKPLFSVDAARLAGPRFPAALGMRHSDLRSLLADSVVRAGGVMHVSSAVADVQCDALQGQVWLEDGQLHTADLVVLACGPASPLRERVFDAPPSPVAAQWFYFLSPRPPAIDDAYNAANFTGDKLHVVPVGPATVGVRISARGRDTLDAAAARGLLGSFAGLGATLADLVRNDVLIACRLSRPGLLREPWARGRVVAAGDCAHALPPQFGQTAAQNIEDAIVLGELLAAAVDPREVPHRFEDRRRPRASQVMAITMQAAQWDAAPETHTDLVRLARDLADIVGRTA